MFHLKTYIFMQRNNVFVTTAQDSESGCCSITSFIKQIYVFNIRTKLSYFNYLKGECCIVLLLARWSKLYTEKLSQQLSCLLKIYNIFTSSFGTFVMAYYVTLIQQQSDIHSATKTLFSIITYHNYALLHLKSLSLYLRLLTESC